MVQTKFKEVSVFWIRKSIQNQNPTIQIRPLFICLGNIHNLQALTLVCCWRGKVSLDSYLTRLKLDYIGPNALTLSPSLSLSTPSFSLYLPKHTQTPEVGEKQGTLVLRIFTLPHNHCCFLFPPNLPRKCEKIAEKVTENWAPEGESSCPFCGSCGDRIKLEFFNPRRWKVGTFRSDLRDFGGFAVGVGTHWGSSDGLTQQGTVIGFVGVFKCWEIDNLVWFSFWGWWGVWGFEVSGNAGCSVILRLCGNVCFFSGFWASETWCF